MENGIFVDLFAMLDAMLAVYILDTGYRVIEWLRPIAILMVSLMFALWGFKLLFGLSEEPIKEGIFKVIRVGAIFTFALSLGTYMTVVVGFFHGGAEELAAIVSLDNASIAQMLDNFYRSVYTVIATAANSGGIISGVTHYFVAIIYLLGSGALLILVAFMVLLAKVYLTVLLAIGPLFICMLLFPATKRFFELWLGLLVGAGLKLVLAVGVGALMLSLASEYMDLINASQGVSETIGKAASLAMVMGVASLVMQHVGAMSAGLSGGIALASNGALGRVAGAMRPSNISRAGKTLGKDAALVGKVAGLPLAGALAVHSAYKRTFKSNSINRGD